MVWDGRHPENQLNQKRMDHTPVTSSSVRSIGYDPQTKTLEVAYHGSGQVHAYHGVPFETHTRLMLAKSKGTFIHRNIVPHYRSGRVG